MKTVKVLGTGCPKCKKLAQLVEKVAQENGLDVQLEKVTDINSIVTHGVMVTPGLIVDGAIKATGRVPSEAELLSMLQD